jgi:hypothetical protein
MLLESPNIYTAGNYPCERIYAFTTILPFLIERDRIIARSFLTGFIPRVDASSDAWGALDQALAPFPEGKKIPSPDTRFLIVLWLEGFLISGDIPSSAHPILTGVRSSLDIWLEWPHFLELDWSEDLEVPTASKKAESEGVGFLGSKPPESGRVLSSDLGKG